jgi:hypothetical protein
MRLHRLPADSSQHQGVQGDFTFITGTQFSDVSPGSLSPTGGSMDLCPGRGLGTEAASSDVGLLR